MSDQNELSGPNINDMNIGQLRHYAKHMRLPVSKTATKEEIKELIDRKLRGRSVAELATPESEVKPGYAKIRVLSNPMPGASNLPVYVNANGYSCLIPRDVDVIVPQRVVRVLSDAVVTRKKQTIVQDSHGRETFKETDAKTPSYPFQILEQVPGPEVYTKLEKSKLKTMGPKRRYREMFGHWPRPKQLTRAIEQGLIKLNEDESLDAAADRATIDEN